MRKFFLLLALCCNFAAASDTEYRVAYIVTGDEKSAVEIIRQLKNKANFDQLAREKSLDMLSADSGGDAGWLTAGELNGPVGAALKDMRRGEFSQVPIKVGTHWYVLQVNGTRTGGETYMRGETFMPGYDSDDQPRAARQSIANRNTIRSLRAKAITPPYASMPPVTEANVPAPAGATDYNSAYQTSGGCVFFYERNDSNVATHAEWNGPPCKGKTVSGKGILRVTGLLKTADGTTTFVQHEMRGAFVNGLLNGVGEKTNFHYKADKTPIQDDYLLSGEFKNGLLHGYGRRIWLGAQNARPNAIEWRGHFVDGLTSGVQRMMRSQPYEGVIGDVVTLAYAPSGNSYVEQAAAQRRLVEGTMYFDNEDWAMYVTHWKGQPKAAVFVRIPDYTKPPGDSDYVSLTCEDWQAENLAWGCKEGLVKYYQAGTGMILQAEKAAFTLPIRSVFKGFKVMSNPTVYLDRGMGIDKNNTLRCNSDWSACSGKAKINLAGPFGWRGGIAYRNGTVTPDGYGKLLAFTGGDSGMEEVAECSRFASPTDCENGTIYLGNGNSVESAFRLKNLTYGPREGSRIAGYQSKGEIEIEPYGWGTVAWSNGRWAKVRHVNGKTVEVGECGWARHGEDFTCSLSGTTVMFREFSMEDWGETERPSER